MKARPGFVARSNRGARIPRLWTGLHGTAWQEGGWTTRRRGPCTMPGPHNGWMTSRPPRTQAERDVIAFPPPRMDASPSSNSRKAASRPTGFESQGGDYRMGAGSSGIDAVLESRHFAALPSIEVNAAPPGRSTRTWWFGRDSKQKRWHGPVRTTGRRKGGRRRKGGFGVSFSMRVGFGVQNRCVAVGSETQEAGAYCPGFQISCPVDPGRQSKVKETSCSPSCGAG